MPPVKKPKVKSVEKSNEEEVIPVVSGQLKKKIQRQQNRQRLRRGVVFIKHLPHGFFEDQLRNYFSQFGTVTRLRLARSKITGGTKGYAYIEFEYPEVAEVAAETMDNYLMFNRLIKATYIPPEKQIFNFFKSSVRCVKNKAGKVIYVSRHTATVNNRVKKFNETSERAYQKRTKEKLKRIQELNKKYAHLGIDFNNIVVGSKKISEKEENAKSVEDKDSKVEEVKLETKPASKETKKAKKTVDLEDLLGETLNEDSDDEDFVVDSDGDDHSEGDPSKSLDLEDLLGETLNEDSEDDVEWAEEDDNEGSQSDEKSLSETDDENEEEHSSPKIQKKTGKVTKGKKTKVDTLEKLTKHKKHTGGVQKTSKVLSKKPKMAKAKNAMHAALTKQLAQPLPQVKSKVKKSKKQKH